jgi:hypothetical protein
MVSAASVKIGVQNFHVSESVSTASGAENRKHGKTSQGEAQPWLAQFLAQLATVATISAIVIGFYLKRSEIFVPGEGVGYKLGISGGISMLVLLFYPMAKRASWMGFQKNSVTWLRAHMLLGVLGPMLIFYHANFSMGAVNSNVALFSMIVVAASGVIGRFIYTRIHKGMSYTKLDLGSLLAKSSRLLADVGQDVGPNSAAVAKAMANFAESSVPKSQNIIPNLIAASTMSYRKSAARYRIMAELRKAIRKASLAENWSREVEKTKLEAARLDVLEFLACVSKASQLSFWERMFSLWHVLHVPLFFVLLVSGVLHVIAVHIY